MKPVGFGLLGASNIADHAFVPAMKKTEAGKIIAVAARDLKKAEAFANRHSIPSAYGSYEAMLEDPEVEAVYISLPNHLHAYWGKKALAAEKHIIVEKPVTNSVKELEDLYKLAKPKKLVVMEAFMFLYNDRLHEVLEMIRKGVVGKIRTVHADFSVPLIDQNDIRYINEPGSGGLADLGTYTNMLAEQVMGSWPESVDCRLVKVKPGHHADIHFTALMEYSEGRTAVISGGMASQITCEAFIVGEKGTIILHDFLWANTTVPIHLRIGDKRSEISIKVKNHYVREIEDMVKAIHSKSEPFVSSKISLNHRRVLDACLESAKLNRPVHIKKSQYK